MALTLESVARRVGGAGLRLGSCVTDVSLGLHVASPEPGVGAEGSRVGSGGKALRGSQQQILRGSVSWAPGAGWMAPPPEMI